MFQGQIGLIKSRQKVVFGNMKKTHNEVITCYVQ